MKERRKAGATHSFRLTRRAADIVDRLNHPRSLGGKSRQVSDAIEYYFDTSKGVSIADLQEQIEIFVTDIERLEAKIAQQFSKNPEKRPKVPGWWRRFF